jgi:Secretion system C-terminal sorting domain
LVKQLEMQFNFSTNAWDTKFTKYISYLANNNYASILTVIPNMIQGGLDSSKKIITYTGNNITNILQMDREALATSWINLEQNTISYDANNNEKTVTNQNFDIATTTWKNVMKDELYYNGNNKIIVDSNFIFDTVTNAWVIGGASKVSYDNNNFRKNIISVFYDGANVDSIKINFMVDADGDMTKQEINNVLFGIWVPIVTTNYYYEQKPAQVPNAIKLSSLIIEVNTYPNPVQDKLLVNVTCNNNMQVSCNIIDMQGRQMMKNNMKLISGKNQKTITTEALPIGMYLLVIQSANGDYVCKKFNKN